MPTPRIREKRRPKPPACDFCKSRRVLCHPQPYGAPCPRCAEKNLVCTTTPVPRGRPRKNPVPDPQSPPQQQELASYAPSSSSMTVSIPVNTSTAECPDLTPQLVSHFFQCFDQLAQVLNPLTRATSINTKIRAVSYQLCLLPSQCRVLALCIIAFSSLVSYHEVMLGDGPRPESFYDQAFFASKSNVRGCGARRSAVHRALHTMALKAAWDCGIMLEVSNENAASCFFLDLIAQGDVCSSSRPWASAYMSHLRALAPSWRTSGVPPASGARWAGFLMVEGLVATRNRNPILITHDDQLLLCGSAPSTAEALLASLEGAAGTPGTTPIHEAMKPYMFHVTCLARKLWNTITGDNARFSPVSEGAVVQFLGSLSLLHAILSFLLDRVDAELGTSTPDPQTPYLSTADGIVRACASGLILGFAGLALPLHRELEYRAQIPTQTDHLRRGAHAQERMFLLRSQAREMAALGASALARASRYLPPIHYSPMQWNTLRDYAQFALEEAPVAGVLLPERLRDLENLAHELRLVSYSLDICASSHDALLVERLDEYLDNAQAAELFDTEGLLAEMFLPLDPWMSSPGGGALLG